MNLSLRSTIFSWFGLWVAIACISIFMLWPLRKSLRFGIDLVGGTYIMLRVQTEKAIEAELKNRLVHSQEQLQKDHLTAGGNIHENSLVFSFKSADQAQKSVSILQTMWKDMTVAAQQTEVKATLNSFAVKAFQEDAVQRNIEVLRSRLDQLSVAEISIARHGESDIVIELPDVKDPQQAKAMIGKAAVLEFKMVHQIGNNSVIGKTQEDIIYEMGGEIPSNLEILPGNADERGQKVYYLVSRNAQLTGSSLRTAHPQINEQGQMAVGFEFTPEGGDRFYNLTSKNINKRLAIVLDNVVISAPVIQSAIRTSGSITHSGGFAPEEAKELALLLRSGSFVAPVTFEEEREIGPSLGAQAIHQGLLACLVGLGLLFVFSIFYYKLAGLLAFSALIFNLLLVLLGLSQLHATLTLPGIAGIVLTLGMAIDASILIFERIKEELAHGSGYRKAVNAGFSDAMTVILDANITTFIVGVVLYRFGTGPIQGFAVTMMLGIVSTLLTGLFFLRSFFSFILDNFSVQKLRI